MVDTNTDLETTGTVISICDTDSVKTVTLSRAVKSHNIEISPAFSKSDTLEDQFKTSTETESSMADPSY